jgi:hypothetical protein
MTFRRHLTTPIIVTADMTEAEFADEWAAFQLREQATTDFCNGKIDAADWFDVLDGCGVPVDATLRDWSLGITYS